MSVYHTLDFHTAAPVVGTCYVPGKGLKTHRYGVSRDLLAWSKETGADFFKRLFIYF